MILRFIGKLTLFLVPFISIFVINVVVDPFDYSSRNLTNLIKDPVSTPLNYRLSKLLKFENNPKGRIILGDSRMDAFNTDSIKKYSGKEYINLSYAACTLEEIFRTIGFAKNQISLEEIVIGIPFNVFDASNSRERVSRALQTIKNPGNYYFSFSTLKASIYVLYFNLTGVNLASENPNMNKSVFWKQQLKLADNTYNEYNYPIEYSRKLIDLKNYCELNDIKLVIIIPPTHTDLQSLVHSNGLTAEYQKYKKFLNSISITYDFDVNNNVTNSRDNFRDPYHCESNVVNDMISEIWRVK